MKKLLSFVLVVAMVLSSFTFVMADDYGKTHYRNPVEISTVADLKNLAAIVNSDIFGCEGETFVLTNDIDLGGEAWNRWLMGSLDNPFRGTFDGNGYVIRNFSMQCTEETGYGLFAVMGGNGVIKNLGIEKTTARASQYAQAYGGVVGFLIDNATVENCYAKEVKPTADGDGYMVVAGGLVGKTTDNATVKNCYAIDCDMDQALVNFDGGLIGWVEGCNVIENCYSNTTLARATLADNSKIVNCYYGADAPWPWAGTEGDTYRGTKVMDDELKTKADALGDAFMEGTIKTNGYPALSWQEIEVDEAFGAAGAVVKVGNLAQLQSIASYADTDGMSFKMTADIDLGGADWNDFVIGTTSRPFKGTFDGNGHIIKNFKFKSTGANGEKNGLFGVVGGNAVIKNLGLENIEVYYGVYGPCYSGSYFAGIAAELVDNAAIENCFVKGFEINTKQAADTWAGFAGDQPTYAGSIAALINGAGVTVKNCYQTGWVEHNDSVSTGHGLIGAIIEGMGVSVENCYSDESILTCKNGDVSKVNNCYAIVTTGWSSYGNMPGNSVTEETLKTKASALGSAYVEVSGSYPKLAWEVTPIDDGSSDGDSDKPTIPAGEAMQGDGSIDNPYVLSEANHILEVAAMISTKGKYFSLANDINVNSAVVTNMIKDFEGYFDGNGFEIKNFELEAQPGGVAGLFATVKDGAVITDLGVKNVNVVLNGSGATAGGIIGKMEGGAVTNCYIKNLWFNVTGGSYAIGGGLIGEMAGGAVTECYSVGVAGATFVDKDGGLIGYVSGADCVKDCYSDTTLARAAYGALYAFENVYQHTAATESGSWPATVTDIYKLGYDFSDSFVPTKTMGPKLKYQMYDGYVNMLTVPYTSEGKNYSIDTEKDAYYKISADSYFSATMGFNTIVANGKAGYFKADATGKTDFAVTGREIKNLRLTKVDIAAEMKEAEASIVLDAPLNKVSDVDFFIPTVEYVCGDIPVVYESANGYVDEVSGFVSSDVYGYGIANDTFTATVTLADKQVVKSIDIGIKKIAPYEILNSGLVNANGNQVYTIAKAAKIDTVYVNINTDTNADIFAALYKDGKLVKAAKGTQEGTKFKFDMAVDGADNVKIFAVEENSIQPLALPFEPYASASGDEKITVYTVGDSLVQTYNPAETDLVGWGQLIGERFDSSKVVVNNDLSRSGMSAHEFIELGRFNNLLKALKPGDYALIQLSTNDMYQSISLNDFEAQINQLVSGVKEKGAVPVFVTSPDMLKDGTASNTMVGGKYVVNSTIKPYVNVVRSVAEYRQIPLVELNQKTIELMEQNGYSGVKAMNYYVADELHFNMAGSTWLTGIIMDGIKELGLPISDFVL